MYDLVVKNCRILDPGQSLDCKMDVGIADGRIVALSPHLRDGTAVQALDVSAADTYVVPGLIDAHAHVAEGATTPGVGMQCCDPDDIGVRSGVTSILDAGSVGICHIGVFQSYILPRTSTRVFCYLNVGSFAHSTPDPVDVRRSSDIDEAGISECLAANEGLVSGLKLRFVGPLAAAAGEELVARVLAVAQKSGLQLMVHVGDPRAKPEDAGRLRKVTRFALSQLRPGDVLTHLCTPHIGGVGAADPGLIDVARAARDRGVFLDSGNGRTNFSHQVARGQRELGLEPDTISTDLTAQGEHYLSLVECMSQFMALGYSLSEVIEMTTIRAARVIGQGETLGAIKVGRPADLTILKVVAGNYKFVDGIGHILTGNFGIEPVQTIRSGRLFEPRWGTHPWGWLPEAADRVPAG